MGIIELYAIQCDHEDCEEEFGSEGNYDSRGECMSEAEKAGWTNRQCRGLWYCPEHADAAQKGVGT